MRKIVQFAACAALVAAFIQTAFAQTKTTVADTLYSPAGTALTGTMTITNNATFTAADGTVVPKGAVATVPVVNGAFSVALVPNAGSTPAGSSYNVIYSLGSDYLHETWVVPSSSNPVNLAVVRTSPVPAPSVMVAASQLPATISASAIEDKGGQVFNVKAYGAKGDGSTDDSAPVASAITAAESSGGVVYFPCGTYEIASGLTISNPVSMEGESGGCASVQATSALTGNMITLSASNVSFRDITIDAAQHASQGINIPTSESGITLERTTLENANEFNFYAGPQGASDVLVQGSTFKGAGAGDVYLGVIGSYASSHIRITSSRFGSTSAPSNLDTGQAHVSLYFVSNGGGTVSGITVSNNQIYFPILASQETDGVVISGGLGSPGTLSNVTVASNIIEGDPATAPAHYANALEIANVDAATISGNVLINGQRAILVEPDSSNDEIHGTITGNYVNDTLAGIVNAIEVRTACLYSVVGNYIASSSSGGAIQSDGEGSIANNQVVAGGTGIVARNGGISVTGNTITEGSSSGYPIEMRCMESSDCLSDSVTGNTIHGHASGYGIYFVGSTNPFANVSVTGNSIDSSYYGILFNTTGDSGILANNSFSSVTKPYQAIPALVITAQRGTSAPSGSCSSGSRYVNTSGGTGTTFYGCEAGAWVAH